MKPGTSPLDRRNSGAKPGPCHVPKSWDSELLAAEGLRFEHAYSTVAVCQPVRQIMQTGLYPHRSGSMGFFPLKPEVRTLNQQLHDAGYLIPMFGKINHHQPTEKFCADVANDRISPSPARCP